MEIRDIIRTRRTALGMKQRELEEAAGLRIKSVSFYETGRRQVPTQYLKPIAEALKMSVDELVGKEEKKNDADRLVDEASATLLKVLERYFVERK